MKKFNYDSYMRDNPLLKETSGIGNYIPGEKMLENDEEEVDLFDDIDSLPDEVKAVLDKYSEEDHDYKVLKNMEAELEALGYTFEYGLDAEPYGLKKIGDGDSVNEDDEPQAGENLPLGPDEELLEGSGKVSEVYSIILENVKSAIKKYGLDEDDVQELRDKLAEFFR